MTSSCVNLVCTGQGTVNDQGACVAASGKSLCLTAALLRPTAFLALQQLSAHGITFVLFADCKIAASSCLNSKCSSPHSIPDNGTCVTGSGRFLCQYCVFL